MAVVSFSALQAALATLFDDEIANQINRAVVLAQIYDVGPGTGKNVSWTVQTGTATPSGAVIADGADVTTFNNDTKQPASLDFGTYHDAFSITGKIMAAARAAGNPRELAALFSDELGDSVTRLARAIGADVYSGAGGTDEILGLFGSPVAAIGDTGTYAGIDRSAVTQWQGNVIDAAGAGLSFALIRQLRREVYTASGMRLDLFTCDPIQHEKLGLLYQAERRYVSEVRTQQGVIKLDGGYNVLEFDGIPVVEDVQHPSGVFAGHNTMAGKICQLPDSPDAMNRGMGRVSLGGTPEYQYGEGRTGLTARIQPLAIDGDAFKFALYCYPQLQIKRCNAFGYLTNLAS